MIGINGSAFTGGACAEKGRNTARLECRMGSQKVRKSVKGSKA